MTHNQHDAGSNALIALGANLPSVHGNPAETLNVAIRGLAEQVGVIRAISSFFATPAFPKGNGPDYVNAAVQIETALDAQAILERLHRIEADCGRVRVERWGQRTLDLDLIALGQTVLPDAARQTEWRTLPPERQIQAVPGELILPHPRLQDRAFVLVPLAQIAPEWRHPLTGATIRAMLAALPAADLAEVRPLT